MADLRMLEFPLFDLSEPVFNDNVSLLMPPCTPIAHVAMQNQVAMLWAMCDMEMPKVERKFYIAATGESLRFVPCYLGTVHHREFVWHIFESFPDGRTA